MTIEISRINRTDEEVCVLWAAHTRVHGDHADATIDPDKVTLRVHPLPQAKVA